ncbi:hypothetical protein [Halobacteriovorax sp. JY17]|uniref:hypothetical protein n=1 Tax=Halobacteriovorax sp. JY17 TaxID=2014617 RepID=UPI000C4F918F|nr:hypothetical protein [Halobacteriovorax sp. JY17]PIK16094.1 MAG: hypothetical protein CES88_05010 [Halobacteriovorax sp. JY17]
MSTKPLIFIYPLSETMKKLKEAIEEISESEGVEIYEVDDLTEVAQLVPTIGQSLSIYGAPKKCAMALKQLKKINSKLNSKVLLLNEKSIPRKTLDKFSKIGLTEFIQEPVPAKTLLYKVKLQLKSIVNDEFDEEEEEVGVKSSNESTEEADESVYKSSKNNNQGDEEDDGLDYLTKKKKKAAFEIEQAEKKKKKSNYHEEEIDSHWQGKLTKEELSLEDVDLPEKEKANENLIDNYLRGKQDTHENIGDEEEQRRKNNYRDEILDENLSSNAKRDSLEADYATHKNKAHTELDLDDIKKDLQRELQSDLTHYKGSVSTHEEESEDEEKKKKKGSTILNVEQEKDFTDYDEDDEHLSKKKKKPLTILNMEEKELTQEHYEEESEEKKKKSHQETLEVEKPASESLVEHLNSEETSGKGSTDKLDKYLRGGSAKKGQEEENKEDEKDLKTSAEISLEENDLDLDDQEENEDKNSKDYNKDAELKIDRAKKDLEKEEHSYEEESEDYLKKKKSVDLQFDPSSKEKSELEEEEERNYQHKKEKSAELEEREKQARTKQEIEEEKKNKTHESKTDNLTKEKMKSDSKVDKIQTHYSSEASVSHVDDDWNFSKSEKKVEKEESLRKDLSESMSYGEKVDLGEQTIDYRKLKDEFGGITIDRSGNSLKKTGPKYYGGGPGRKAKTPSYYRDDEEQSEELLNEESTEEQMTSEDQIFEPISKGLENIIKVLNFYNLNKDADEQAYKYVSKIIQSNFNGEMALFYYDEKKSRVNEATNSLNLLGDMELEAKKPIWDKLFSRSYRSWKDIKLPTWSDETFQDDNIQFIYPYFEGASLMGFAVTWFTNKFDEKRCRELEVTLETLRGFLIANFRKGMHTGEYNGQEKKEEKVKSNPIKSLFGSLFKRKAS